MEHITLYFKEGRSDKVYQASIEPKGDRKFVVNFAYGRRGQTSAPERKLLRQSITTQRTPFTRSW